MANDLYERKIQDGLKAIAESHGPDIIKPVTVVSVDEENFLCDCIDDLDNDMPQVLYNSIQGGSGYVVFEPAINSRIYIGKVEDSDQWIMVMPGKINKVIINADTLIQLNGGTHGGLVLRDGVKEQLNKIEADLNTIKTVFTTWVPVTGDGGAALKALTATWAGETLTETVNADIENTAITQ